MTYEQKSQRLDEILERPDKSETPMDVSDAREATQLIRSMKATLKSTNTEIAEAFGELDEAEENEAD